MDMRFGGEEFDKWYDDAFPFVLDLYSILMCSELHPVVRKLAGDIMKNQYYTIGDILYPLRSTKHLDDLLEFSEYFIDNGPGNINFSLFTLLVAQAEGNAVETEEDLRNCLAFLIMFLNAMSLESKGLAYVYYENLTFSTDEKSQSLRMFEAR